jgi:hypothetical protein
MPFSPPDAVAEDQLAALLFALVAERLTVFYEHGTWLTLAQGNTLATSWLPRAGLSLSVACRKHLSQLSDQLARQIAGSVSRQAGLFIAHEMTEALDPRYVTDSVEGIREECRRLLAANPIATA